MFYHAYNGYLNHAYPFDELKPITCKGMDTWGRLVAVIFCGCIQGGGGGVT